MQKALDVSSNTFMQKPICFIVCVCLFCRCDHVQQSSSQKSKSEVFKLVDVNINDSVINSKDVQAIIDPVWWTGDIYQSHDHYLNSLKGFSDNQRFVYAIQWYQDEVDNGGHEQFFYNSTGIVWEDALKGFSKIGLNRYYTILSQAANKMGNSVPFDRNARIKRLETLEPDFDSLDAQFYKLDSVQSLQDALVDFIQKNRSDFYFKGVIKKPLNAD